MSPLILHHHERQGHGQRQDSRRHQLGPYAERGFLFLPGARQQRRPSKVKDEDVGINETMGKVDLNLADIRAAEDITNKAYEIFDKKGNPVKGKNGKTATLALDLQWT